MSAKSLGGRREEGVSPEGRMKVGARRGRRPRLPERILMGSAALWNLLLAVITLFPYQMWLTSEGYDILGSEDAMDSGSAVAEVVSVVRLYGIALLLFALVTAVIAWRMSVAHRSGIVWWLGVGTLLMLATRDVVSVLLLSVALVLYLSRSRAMRRLEAETGPATSPARTEQTEEV